MAYTDEEARAIQQEIQGAVGMLPRQNTPAVKQQRNPFADYIDQEYKRVLDSFGGDEKAAKAYWNDNVDVNKNDPIVLALERHADKDNLVDLYNRKLSGEKLDDYNQNYYDWLVKGWDKARISPITPPQARTDLSQSQQAATSALNAEVQKFAQRKVNANSQASSPNIFAIRTQKQNPQTVQTGAVSQPIPKEVADKLQQLENESKGGVIHEGPGYVNQGRGRQQNTIDPNSSTAGMDYLNSLYTSPEEENRLRKASVANQRIMAVADALRHIGNIAHTVNYAPSQQFNNPVQEERQRYLQSKAIRDKANLTYLNYQQAKANQDLKMQQLSDSTDLKLRQLAFNQDKFNRQQNLNEFKAKNDKWYKEATVEQKEKALEIQQALADGRISLMDAQRALAEVKTRQGGFAPKSGSRGGNGSGYTTVTKREDTYDANGKKNGYQTTTTKTVGGKTTTTSKGKAYGNKEEKQGKGRGY